MAQLGTNELTPPTHRIPTRMFRDPEGDGWRPYHTFKRKKQAAAKRTGNGTSNGDGDGDGEDDWEWVEDQDSDEGAVYPLRGKKGRCEVSTCD